MPSSVKRKIWKVNFYIVTQICDVLGRWIFNMKKTLSQLQIEEELPSLPTTLNKDFCLVWFSITSNLNIRYDIGSRVRTHYVNDAESLDFVISGAIKKMQVYQRLDVDVVTPACSFINKETPAHVFSCEFWEFF